MSQKLGQEILQSVYLIKTNRTVSHYQVLGVEQVSVDAKEGGNDYCIYLGVEQVYYT